ncbi:MAG: hypothetical protein O2887_03850 [Bacteroidetes bacterium]|nr:hypothetical protein [Bacteroidota bacterium]MDA1119620.1 hypothetical protein [Bacteroidota bacterium]
MAINIHITPSEIKNASRILKETKSISSYNLFDQVVIAAKGGLDIEEEQILNHNRYIWNVTVSNLGLKASGLRMYLKGFIWMIKIFWRFKGYTGLVINCHHIEVLLLCWLLKWSTNGKLIYDTHELETERHYYGPLKRSFYKILERILIKKIDFTIVVSPLIENWYVKTYNVQKIATVRNIPEVVDDRRSKSNVLREEFKIPVDHIIFIYQGGFISGRFIEELLQVFNQVEATKHIVFMGYGYLVNEIIERCGYNSNIHYKAAVPPEEVEVVTRSADVGMCMIENVSLSYYYSAPNKLFEYLLSGLPVIHSDFPYISQIANDYDCGWKASFSVDKLVGLVNSIDKNSILKKKKKLNNIHKCLNWENEAQKMNSIYQGIMDN